MANSKRKNRRKIIVFSTIIVILAALTVYVVKFRKKEIPITVQVEKVTRRDLIELVPANGKIQPVFQVKISPEVSGEIIELPVKEGQVVKKGDLLLKIKPDMYVADRNSSEASYKSALASKSSAEANLIKMEAEFKRNDELFRNKLVSDSAFLEAKTAYDVCKLQVAGAEQSVQMATASLRRADENLAKTTIFSPLDGTVSKLNSQLGERVVGTAMMAGTEVMTVADLNEMEARVDIGEVDVVLISVGQTTRLEVDAFRDRKFAGLVTEIANSSKTTMGSGGSSQEATKFEVKIRIKEKQIFRPGMSVSAEIETRSRTNVLTVPIGSVTTRLPKEAADGKTGDAKKGKAAAKTGETNAAPKTNAGAAQSGATNAAGSATNTTKANGTKKLGEAPKPIEVVFLNEDGKAKMMLVKRGISDDNYVEIIEGVKEGQEVVSGGYKAISRELEDGKKIKIGPAKNEPGKETKT